jgi:hypothetical protein
MTDVKTVCCTASNLWAVLTLTGPIVFTFVSFRVRQVFLNSESLKRHLSNFI